MAWNYDIEATQSHNHPVRSTWYFYRNMVEDGAALIMVVPGQRRDDVPHVVDFYRDLTAWLADHELAEDSAVYGRVTIDNVEKLWATPVDIDTTGDGVWCLANEPLDAKFSEGDLVICARNDDDNERNGDARLYVEGHAG